VQHLSTAASTTPGRSAKGSNAPSNQKFHIKKIIRKILRLLQLKINFTFIGASKTVILGSLRVSHVTKLVKGVLPLSHRLPEEDKVV